MTREAKKYLYDISAAIEHIFSVHLSATPSKESYQVNLTVQRAIERELAIIGEACLKLTRMQISLEKGDRMINRRNTLVHQYDAFHPSSIWDLVHHDLPPLKEEVDELLKP